MPTKIEWCDETWNPITGCEPVSVGCVNCYAKKMAQRMRGRHGYPYDNPFTPATFHKDQWLKPRKTKIPKRFFVCSMGDLFHKAVPDFHIRCVLHECEKLERHIFILLTKRPERMVRFIKNFYGDAPLPRNIWIGVTAEDQENADWRINLLLQINAPVRFVSCEPLLGFINLRHIKQDNEVKNSLASGQLSWVICGAETGVKKREMLLGWAIKLLDDCVEANIPFFFKKDSGGNHELEGDTYEQFPS